MGDRYTMWRELRPRVILAVMEVREKRGRGTKRGRENGEAEAVSLEEERTEREKRKGREEAEDLKRSSLPWQEGGDWEWAELVL